MVAKSEWAKMPIRWIHEEGLAAFRGRSTKPISKSFPPAWPLETDDAPLRNESLAALKLYLVLCCRADFSTGMAKVTYTELCKLGVMSRAVVARSLQRLEKAGLIKRETRALKSGSLIKIENWNDAYGWGKIPKLWLYDGNHGRMLLLSEFNFTQLSFHAMKIYMAILAFRDRRGIATISYDRLAACTGVPRHHVADPLMHACPECSHPFFRKLRLLPSLSEPCICGWSALAPATVNKGTQLEKKFAEFAHELLQRNLPLMSSDALCSSYLRQCRTRGFIHGKLAGTAKLFDSIRDKYGDEALSQMDSAYATGKHEQWIRFTSYKGQMDMPLARHLIIALHLFRSADEFESALKKELILQSIAGARLRSKPEKPQIGRKAQFRQKIETILAVRADARLEHLWKNAYQATRWLNENDNAWLMAKLSTPKHESAEVEDVSDPRDSAFAAILLAGAEDLYRISKGQKRVNLTNLHKLLPVRLPPDPSTRKRRFPLASQQVELLLESVWHFRLRRLICALADIARLNLPMNTGSLKVVSSVPLQIFPAIVSFFEWDLESFIRNGVEPEALLKSTGVSRDWQGPPGFNVVLGGSAYYQ